MRILKMVFFQMMVWVVVGVASAPGGPVYCLDIKFLETAADLVCGGQVVSIENRGRELLSLHGANVSSASFEADILLAKVLVLCTFKGSATNAITIKCHRNLMAWVPGISEGAYLLFLKREGDIFVPVQESGYALPIDAQALRARTPNMQEMLKATIAKGKRDTIRICLDALSQLAPEGDVCSYAKELAAGRDDFVRGTAILYLTEKGDRSIVASAEAFATKAYEDRELKNLGAEISHALADRKEKEKGKTSG